MSYKKTQYVVVGYDLSDIRKNILTEEWCEDANNEYWERNQVPGEIKLFSDPCSGHHLIFGYICSAVEQGDYTDVTSINVRDLNKLKETVDKKLDSTGLNVSNQPIFKVIIFTEVR